MLAEFLAPDTDPAVARLAHDLDQARTSSYPLTLAIARLLDPERNPATALDGLATTLGYQALGSGWIELPRRSAAKVLTHLIGGELAYPAEVVPHERAEELAARLVELFPANARYFTNGAISGEVAVYDLAGAAVLGWRSLSAAPLDNGIAIFSPTRVGLLWAEDAP